MTITSGIDRRHFLAASAGLLGVMLTPIGMWSAQADSPGTGRITAHRRPMFIERAGLRVENLEAMILFYQQVIGLEVIQRQENGALLGVGGVSLIELVRGPDAKPARPEDAGLYHVAFVMPTRRDLARWIVHAARHHFQVSGLADHRVTESVYLNDPEGNGIEVYSERPEAQWEWSSGEVAMGVFDLDIDDLLKLVDREKDDYSTAPPAMRIGHIHLKVSDLTAAEDFYSGLIGLNVTRRAPGVVFMSSGKYHHHVAVNIWESQGAKARDARALGLSWFSVAVTDRAMLNSQEQRLRKAGIPIQTISEGLEVADPWGNRIRLRQAAPKASR